MKICQKCRLLNMEVENSYTQCPACGHAYQERKLKEYIQSEYKKKVIDHGLDYLSEFDETCFRNSELVVTYSCVEDIKSHCIDQYVKKTVGDVYIPATLLFGSINVSICFAKFSVYYIDGSRADQDCVDLFKICYSCDRSLSDLYRVLFQPIASQFKQDVCDAISMSPKSKRILFVSNIEILPGFRRQELGLRVLEYLISRLGFGASLVVVAPYPLQFELKRLNEYGEEWASKMGIEDLSERRVKSFKKLRDHYRRAGFSAFGNNPYMIKRVDKS